MANSRKSTLQKQELDTIDIYSICNSISLITIPWNNHKLSIVLELPNMQNPWVDRYHLGHLTLPSGLHFAALAKLFLTTWSKTTPAPVHGKDEPVYWYYIWFIYWYIVFNSSLPLKWYTVFLKHSDDTYLQRLHLPTLVSQNMLRLRKHEFPYSKWKTHVVLLGGWLPPPKCNGGGMGGKRLDQEVTWSTPPLWV